MKWTINLNVFLQDKWPFHVFIIHDTFQYGILKINIFAYMQNLWYWYEFSVPKETKMPVAIQDIWRKRKSKFLPGLDCTHVRILLLLDFCDRFNQPEIMEEHFLGFSNLEIYSLLNGRIKFLSLIFPARPETGLTILEIDSQAGKIEIIC